MSFLRLLAPALVLASTIVPQTFPSTSPSRVVKSATPAYTKDALDAKIEGTVVLSFTVEADGTLSGIAVVRGLGKGLDEKAIECLERWQFKPASNGGTPIPSKARAEINFRLPRT
jgi:TonB family protein